MRSKPERALRIIGGALLGSDLNAHELLELSERILFDRAWRERLSRLLRDLAHVSRARYGGEYVEYEDVAPQEPEEFAAEITRLFSRKRLRKQDALAILRKASNTKSWKPQPRRTVRENATKLVRTLGGPEEARVLVADVAEILGYGRDPYLRGLS